ncbi:protein of unknown function [Paenibacillus alvei]|uniref:Uncharacterized protein n=1 Tax=Paenibacillus alvei TaxID=44250 RepID=A0A383RL35_PAEAL|nr:protein of unknown function [Paenibacillus alvei]
MGNHALLAGFFVVLKLTTKRRFTNETEKLESLSIAARRVASTAITINCNASSKQGIVPHSEECIDEDG